MWTCSDWIIKWPKWKNWLASQSWCVWNERPKVSDTDLLGFLSSSLVIHRHIVLTAASWGWHSHWVRVLQWADLIGSREWMYKLDYIRNRCESKTMDLGIWIVFSLFLSTKQQLNLFLKKIVFLIRNVEEAHQITLKPPIWFGGVCYMSSTFLSHISCLHCLNRIFCFVIYLPAMCIYVWLWRQGFALI